MAARYSFVIPVYDEVETLPELERRLVDVLGRLDGEAEVIFVDDGSTDGTAEMLDDLQRRDARFKIVRFTRNFGHQIAVTAGMDFATGDATIIMDADLQDPPEVALDLVARWREGYEIVYGVRNDRRREPLLRRTAIKLSYRLLHRLGSIDLPEGAGDFRLVDRRALDQLRQMRESNRYVRGLVAWTGFRQIGVPYPRGARHAGRTKYPLGKLVTLGVDGLLGFSRAPLTIAIVFGFAVSSTAFGLGVVAIALRIANVGTVPGWASVVVVMSFLGGVQLIVTGMVGTYVGRIYEEVKGRPLYVLRETKGLEAEHLPLSGARVAGSPSVGR
jgi:glycosyltransferase involved in cell wall biosynthesis